MDSSQNNLAGWIANIDLNKGLKVFINLNFEKKILYFTNIFPHYRLAIWKGLLNSK